MEPNCKNCVYLEADKEIINEQIEKIMRLETEFEKRTPKPLAEFLAVCLAAGIDRIHKAGHPTDYTKEGLKPIFEKILDAYEDTENVRINFIKLKEKA